LSSFIRFWPERGGGGEQESDAAERRDREVRGAAGRWQTGYLALLDSGKFENRAALAWFLGVSRSRVTQVLNRRKDESETTF